MLTLPALQNPRQRAERAHTKTNNIHYLQFMKDFHEEERNGSPCPERKKEDEGGKNVSPV